MAKRIDLPADSGFETKLLQDELLAVHHVVYHVLVDWAGFIVHTPTSVEYLQLSTSNQLPGLLLLLWRLLLPPHGKKLHFDL